MQVLLELLPLRRRQRPVLGERGLAQREEEEEERLVALREQRTVREPRAAARPLGEDGALRLLARLRVGRAVERG